MLRDSSLKAVACCSYGGVVGIDSKGARLPRSIPLFTAHCPRDRALCRQLQKTGIASINTKSSNNEIKLLEIEKVLEPSEPGHQNQIIDE